MARTYLNGFEMNDTLSEVVPVGAGATIDATIFNGGARSGKVVAASGVANYFAVGGLGSGYPKFDIRVTARPASTARGIFGTFGTNINLRLNPDGTIAFYNSTTLIGTSTTALTDTNKWYRIEVRLANGSSVTVLRIDGVDQVTGSPSGWAANSNLGATDTVADTYTAYFDNVVTDDSGFPGASIVVLLVPSADNSNTNWRCGDSTTSNLFDGVNNLPPVGLASASETATSNIESASNTGTANYIATMQTYASKGIAAADTVTCIQQIIVEGEDIATGTKTGTYELTQNPVVAATAFTAGNDAGAHGSYPTGWVTRKLITSNPTITNVATAPLMKLVKTDGTTRVLCVCFMGIYVEYVPGLAPDLMGRPYGHRGQRQMAQLIVQ